MSRLPGISTLLSFCRLPMLQITGHFHLQVFLSLSLQTHWNLQLITTACFSSCLLTSLLALPWVILLITLHSLQATILDYRLRCSVRPLNMLLPLPSPVLTFLQCYHTPPPSHWESLGHPELSSLPRLPLTFLTTLSGEPELPPGWCMGLSRYAS